MSAKIKNRHLLKEKEIKNLIYELSKTFHGHVFDTNASVETGLIEHFSMILVNGSIDFFMKDGGVFFTLVGVNKYALKEQYVVVDMGAIKFVTNGADIMGPGIVDADPNIKENDLVWVCDEKYRKPLAVGVALVSGEAMRSKKTGKAVKNIHYVGDELWNLMR